MSDLLFGKEDFIYNLAHTGPDSRVWIYQASGPISGQLKGQILEAATGFLSEWNAHGKALSADAGILFNRFLVFTADEARAAASGCSIDSSVRFVKRLEEETGLNFFDRTTVAYLDNGELKTIPLDALGQFFATRRINEDTLVFNNLVPDLASLFSSWVTPLKSSWHLNYLDQNA